MIQSRWPLPIVLDNKLTPYVGLTFSSLHFRLTRHVACAFYARLPSCACQPSDVATEPFPSAYFVLVKYYSSRINLPISPRIPCSISPTSTVLTGRGNESGSIRARIPVTYSIVILIVPPPSATMNS
ncbi:hypothetical protein PISMIDRAFT_19944 [Pisolithus microcarpus 441]|uniref:Uncharacterized protein n=1 Tax=Pisolithus microcarpus 441 TaxID=765257 RepID=A0A0C9YA81_9AGAM|nr:hypothetical protein PISMIDRAFT_19944 [Pisolithus microcarpus 441]